MNKLCISGLWMYKIWLFQCDSGCINATAGELAHEYNSIHIYSIVSESMKYNYHSK